MTEIIVAGIFLAWYILSLILSETYGKNRKPGVEWLFFISMIFSPFIAFLFIKIANHKNFQKSIL